MGKLDFEQQYQHYLKLTLQDESKMSAIQRLETKRAFMGGCGQTLVICSEELPRLSNTELDNETTKKLGYLFKQINDYFKK